MFLQAAERTVPGLQEEHLPPVQETLLLPVPQGPPQTVLRRGQESRPGLRGGQELLQEEPEGHGLRELAQQASGGEELLPLPRVRGRGLGGDTGGPYLSSPRPSGGPFLSSPFSFGGSALGTLEATFLCALLLPGARPARPPPALARGGRHVFPSCPPPSVSRSAPLWFPLPPPRVCCTNLSPSGSARSMRSPVRASGFVGGLRGSPVPFRPFAIPFL